MEKIVIRTDQSKRASELICMLNRVFPECEVHVLVDAEELGSQELPEGSQSGFKEEEHGQYFHC